MGLNIGLVKFSYNVGLRAESKGGQMYKILVALTIAVLLCGMQGCSTRSATDVESSPIEPREYISKSVDSFYKGSEWEGVWGEMSQCDPLNKIGWCYKQSAIQIYDCYQTQKYNYEDKSAVCTLGLVMSQIPDPAKQTEHLICDSGVFPGEVEIFINGNTAKPSGKYFDLVCSHTEGTERSKCEKNMSFTLSKDSKGIYFHSSKGLDSSTCETPSDESKAGTLSGIYPRFRGSFDCEKQGLSKIEKGICNSFYTLRDDVSLNAMFEYALAFAWSNEQKSRLKKEQLQWLKERNMKCVKAKDGGELLTCLYQAINHRIKELHETIDKSQQVTLELVSQIGAVKIYENPSLKSPVLYTKILNSERENATRDYGAILLAPKSLNGFTKIMLMEFSKDTNPNGNAIVGYVQNANVKRDKEQESALRK
ncbi:DUF1311 domain-containing protein [Helicobacter winghamensis]